MTIKNNLIYYNEKIYPIKNIISVGILKRDQSSEKLICFYYFDVAFFGGSVESFQFVYPWQNRLMGDTPTKIIAENARFNLINSLKNL